MTTTWKMREVESFTLGDLASIESMSRNKTGEVVSPRSYLLIMHACLAEKGGVMDQAELEADLIWHFSGVWGPDDLRLHEATRRPRWLNYLDWAKVEGGKGRTRTAEGKLLPRILNRHGRKNGQPFTILALDVPGVDPAVMAWLRAKPLPKAGFKKNCVRCRRNNPLAAKSCERCGSLFPKQASRTHKLLDAQPVQSAKERSRPRTS